jgi:hypothetical protein
LISARYTSSTIDATPSRFPENRHVPPTVADSDELDRDLAKARSRMKRLSATIERARAVGQPFSHFEDLLRNLPVSLRCGEDYRRPLVAAIERR